jgi:hypothetical protein
VDPADGSATRYEILPCSVILAHLTDPFQHIYNNVYQDYRYQAIQSRSDNQMLVEANAFFGKTRTAATTYGLVIPEDSPNTGPDGDFEIDGYMNLGKSESFLPFRAIINGGPPGSITQVSLTDCLLSFAQRTISATPSSTSPKSATSPRRRTSTSSLICMSCRSLFLLALVLVRFEEEKERESWTNRTTV